MNCTYGDLYGIEHPTNGCYYSAGTLLFYKRSCGVHTVQELMVGRDEKLHKIAQEEVAGIRSHHFGGRFWSPF